MKKGGCVALLLALVLVWPVLSWSQVGEDYNIEIEGRYWMPKLDSTVKVVENLLGNEIKLVDDLGFDDRKNFAEGRFQIKFFKKHKFNLSYLPMKWEAEKTITRTIEFSGTTYTAGTPVQSKLDLNFYKIGYEYDFLAGKAGFLGAGIDVLVANVSVELKAPGFVDQKEDRTIPIPMIGLIGRLYPFRWANLTAKISGIPLGQYGNIIDAEGSLNINPIKYVGISGGYRYFGVDVKYNDNSFDFKLNGPFVALNIRF